MADIAVKHGISFQRSYVLLASVACHWRLRRRKRASRHVDPAWLPSTDDVTRARMALEYWAFRRLTPRQRGALGWLALGLSLPEISERLDSCPSATLDVLLAAFWRLEKAERRASRKTEPDPLPDVGTIDIEPLLSGGGTPACAETSRLAAQIIRRTT